MPSSHESYLRKRGVKGPWRLEGRFGGKYRIGVVIPALAERDTLPRTLDSLAQNPDDRLRQTLVVVVVNQRENAPSAQKQDNQRLLHWLASNSLPNLDLAWVDACRPGSEFSARDGVGLARKIGCDLALSQLDWTRDPLLVSLDADTLVDAAYLPALQTHFSRSACSGVFLPYRHQPGASSAEDAAIRHYELYLRSYQLGLELAGSPYAFTAIGSAIACRASAYVAAGGMKRRQAGEDFYFLQQLAKLGRVEALEGTLVRPSARFSDRVPFGTGRAVEAQVSEGIAPFQFVSSAAFICLKDALKCVAAGQDLGAEAIFQQLQELHPCLGSFLTEIDFCDTWQKLQRNTPPTQFLRAWHNWFDGLRTRQLLHRLMEDCPAQDPERRVGELLAAGGWENLCAGENQLRLLERLQGVAAEEGGLE